MRRYDRNQPLIFVHIPKTGGISTRNILRGWFDGNLHEHYGGGDSGRPLPAAADLARHSPERPLLIYGHFNAGRGLGVEDYYPGACQRVTVIRDPWQRALSGYFYRKRTGAAAPVTPTAPLKDRMLNPARKIDHFFPKGIDRSNYEDVIEEHYIEIGLTERLAPFLQRLAGLLGARFDPGDLGHENVSPRDEDIVCDYADAFREVHELEYLIYDFVAARYGAPPAPDP